MKKSCVDNIRQKSSTITELNECQTGAPCPRRLIIYKQRRKKTVGDIAAAHMVV